MVIDECHHLPAQSFDAFARGVRPKFLLGLTATPLRADGKPIAEYFDPRPDNRPAVELRLWNALDQQLLAPFEYYGTADDATVMAQVEAIGPRLTTIFEEAARTGRPTNAIADEQTRRLIAAAKSA